MVLFFSGIGYACTIIVFLLNCEYNIILTWTFYYLFSSFNTVLPWSQGDNEWNSELCRNSSKMASSVVSNYSNIASSVVSKLNDTMTTVAYTVVTVNTTKCDPVTEFWEYVLLSHLSTCLNSGCWGFCYRKYHQRLFCLDCVLKFKTHSFALNKLTDSAVKLAKNKVYKHNGYNINDCFLVVKCWESQSVPVSFQQLPLKKVRTSTSGQRSVALNTKGVSYSHCTTQRTSKRVGS